MTYLNDYRNVKNFLNGGAIAHLKGVLSRHNGEKAIIIQGNSTGRRYVSGHEGPYLVAWLDAYRVLHTWTSDDNGIIKGICYRGTSWETRDHDSTLVDDFKNHIKDSANIYLVELDNVLKGARMRTLRKHIKESLHTEESLSLATSTDKSLSHCALLDIVKEVGVELTDVIGTVEKVTITEDEYEEDTEEVADTEEPSVPNYNDYRNVSDFLRGQPISRLKALLTRYKGEKALIIQCDEERVGWVEVAFNGPYIVVWLDKCNNLHTWTSFERGVIKGRSCRGVCWEEYELCNTLNRDFMAGGLVNTKCYLVDLTSPIKKGSTRTVQSLFQSELGANDKLSLKRPTDSVLLHQDLLELVITAGVEITSVATVEKVTITTEKETKMTTTSKINSIVTRTKAAGMSAAEFQAGKAMNVAVLKALRPNLPMMVRGYADHAAAPAIVALAVALASEFVPEGTGRAKLIKASDLMLNAAVMEGADKLLNVEALIDSVLSKLPVEAQAMLTDKVEG